MIQIQHKLPRAFYLAWSGGVDSAAVLDFVVKKHMVKLIYVNHMTDHSKSVLKHALRIAEEYGVTIDVWDIDVTVPRNISQEEHWRNERYKVFHSYDFPVVTCHHLDDCIETWVWSSMHGDGKIIPYKNVNVIRPFRLTNKSTFVKWATKHNVEWFEDASNNDTKYMRNYIRHEMMPHVLKINPGISKTIKKKVMVD